MLYGMTSHRPFARVKQNVMGYDMGDPHTPTRKPPEAYHHGNLREFLLDAAMAEVERGGPDSVSLSALAKAAGVSQTAPYRHFSDRDDLLAAVAARGFNRFVGDLQEALTEPSPHTPIRRFARAYLAHGIEQIGLYRLMYGSRLVNKSTVGSPLQREVEQSYLWLLDIVGPEAAVPDREFIALKLWVALHGVVMLVDQGFLPLKIRHVRAEELVDDIVREAEVTIGAARAAPDPLPA